IERLSRMNIVSTPAYSKIPPSKQVNFTSIYYQWNEYRDSSGVKRETQNSTCKRKDLNYQKLAKIVKTRFRDFDRINIMPMNVSDGTEAYFISQPMIEEFGFEEFEKRIAPIEATDVCGEVIEKFPQRGLVYLFKGEPEELSVYRKPMFRVVYPIKYPKDIKYDDSPESLFKLNPEYRKFFRFGTQDFQERLANMHDEGNSIVVIRNCLRQSFGDFKSATIAYKLAEKLKGASLFITGSYDRGMPLFESALDDNFVEIEHNVWGRRDYKPQPKKTAEIIPTNKSTAEHLKSRYSIIEYLKSLKLRK
nr:hypothetical protein [Cyanobacteria bacterium RUI128]